MFQLLDLSYVGLTSFQSFSEIVTFVERVEWCDGYEGKEDCNINSAGAMPFAIIVSIPGSSYPISSPLFFIKELNTLGAQGEVWQLGGLV